jgi:hypothetical protein
MKPIFLFLFYITTLIFSQVFDDFSDGDFTQNPAWSGDDNQFIINGDFQLQLSSSGTSVSQLTTMYSPEPESEWRFWIKMAFSPSANNLARVYLIADEQDLNQPLNGYFLQFGETGSDDAIELYRQNGQEQTFICRGTDGLIANSFAFWVRVRKDNAGVWTIEIDPTGNGGFLTEASGTDNAISGGSFLGVYCKYTSSNSSSFYFDDFYAGPVIIDTFPPELINIKVTGTNTLNLQFDEAIESISASTIQNYFVSNGIEYPRQAGLNALNPSLVELLFDRSFPNSQPVTISIENLADLSGNVMIPATVEFVFFEPAVFDIQINEIMADPFPEVGLPGWEYIELFNTTNLPVDISGWSLVIGNTTKTIQDATIEAGEYLLLGDEAAAGDFMQFGRFYGFSSFALTNAGQLVYLLNKSGEIISYVNYSEGWYGDANKKEGGWSLEQIDPDNPCGGEGNWTASVSFTGGTPGAENSVKAENPDNTAPFASRIEIVNDSALILHFSEPMSDALLDLPLAYEVDQNVGNPLEVYPELPARQTVILIFARPFSASTFYSLKITEDFTDCVGNVIDKTIEVQFGLPEAADPQDIVINEALFNPKDDFIKGVDFVEIYNRSAKIIDLQTLILANEDEDTGEPATIRNISDIGFLMFPQSYLVLTTRPDIVQLQYSTPGENIFVQMASLPAYNNSDGVVILATKGFQIIDRMEYTEQMHFPLLTSVKGVSLERINYNRPADDITNWRSASEDAGFATPGFQNSQFSPLIQPGDPITLDPEIFSPDGDGRDDVLNIYYNFDDQEGNNCNITIYDSRGRQVRRLVENTFLGTSGVFSWDGRDDNNQKADIGIYVVFVEIFDTNGNNRNYRKSAVLATRF